MGLLEQIIEDKRRAVEQLKQQTAIEQFKGQIASLEKCRNFYKAVCKPNRRGFNVIAEVKRSSPSAGIIREDFDPVSIAKIYQRCGADAVSVLTDEKYFQGRLEYIKQVKDAVVLPVLRKDFIVDSWQLYESRAAGADAVLLIAEALSLAQLSDMMITAAELTLTVLLEVHRADTLLLVRSLIGFPRAGYSILGINNRDLDTMKVDINTTGRLAELVDDKKGLVAESGIKTKGDVEKVISAGATAVLIGQALCGSSDIEGKFTELFG